MALRPAAIYGEGEERHLPRIVSYLEQGLLLFTIGDRNNKVDFVYIDNLISAHISAFSAMIKADGCDKPPCGKAYAISDDEPINNFEFFGKLWTGLGYPHPRFNLPYSIMFYLAWSIEIVHSLLQNIWNFQPLLTRGEVNKVFQQILKRLFKKAQLFKGRCDSLFYNGTSKERFWICSKSQSR